jgi:hypothetical protein
MGGKSSSEQNTQTTASSTTDPWAKATPALEGILGKLNPLIQNSGLSGEANGALSELQANAQQGNPFASQINNFASNLLSGGGASDQASRISGGYDTLNSQLSPYASGSMIGNNPALKAQLDTIMSDVGNSINGQFAAAGRDFSGANQQAYGRGVAQGIAPVLANQYNQDVSNQFNAANSIYGANNTTGGLLAGMNQQGLANQLQGVTTSNDALSARNYAPTQALNIEQLRQSIPAQNLGLLAQIGIPIAGLGGSMSGTGTSNTQGSKTMSGAEQFGTIAGGLKNVGQFLWSDERLKEDVAKVGALADGTPVYRYRYIDSPAYHIGLMAQDVEKTTPDAVREFGGFKAVDYQKATARAAKLSEAA